MQTLMPLAARIADRLKARGETIAVAESSSGGLISAALLAVPGASAYYLGGGVIYTGRALKELLGVDRTQLAGMRSSSEPYAQFLARTVRERFRSDWGVSETGAAGPTGNPYGDAPGHTCVAIAGSAERVTTLETASDDRAANMRAFARAALALLADAFD
jgi:PncC family amidohydrolase